MKWRYFQTSIIVKILFAITLILLPFNNLPYFTRWLKELSYYGASYPIIGMMLIILFKVVVDKKIISIKTKTFYFFISLLIWGIISFFINIKSIASSYFKGKTGFGRFVLQYPLLVFSFVVSYIIYYVIKTEKITLYNIRKWILISSIIAGVYSVFEVLYFLKIIDTSVILINISKIIQVYSRGVIYERGVRSVAGEASYFGMYISFAFPWIFSYIYTENKSKNKIAALLFSIYLIVLIFLSRSRVALLVFFVEIFIFIAGIFITKGNKNKKIWTGAIVAVIIFSAIVVNNIFYEGNKFENTSKSLSIISLYNSLMDPNNLSNVARFGMQGAAIRMGITNPIAGVGIGQFGFYVRQYINQDAYKSLEVNDWLNPYLVQYWPTVFSLHSRIIGELGLVGFLIWCAIWVTILYRCIRYYLQSNDIFTLVIFTSVVGTLLGAFNLDTFVYYPLWILLGINWSYLDFKINSDDKNDIMVTENGQ